MNSREEVPFLYEKIISLIKERRSIRSYESIPVPDDIIEKIIEAGIWAPTGSNQQEIRFVVIKHSGLLKEFALFKKIKAPLAILLFADMKNYYAGFKPEIKHLPHKRHLPYIDAGLAMMNMSLVAKSLGIDSCILNVSPYLYYEEYPQRSLLRRILKKIALMTNKNIGGICFFTSFLKKIGIDLHHYKILSAMAFGYRKQGKEIDITTAKHCKNPIMRGDVRNYILKIFPRENSADENTD